MLTGLYISLKGVSSDKLSSENDCQMEFVNNATMKKHELVKSLRPDSNVINAKVNCVF